MNDRDSISGSGKHLSLYHCIQTRFVASLPFYAMRFEVILPWEVNKLDRETDNSFPHTVDVKNAPNTISDTRQCRGYCSPHYLADYR
jgi:hypothetical protein